MSVGTGQAAMDSSSSKENFFFRHEVSSDSLVSSYNKIDGNERLWNLHPIMLYKQLCGSQLGMVQWELSLS